MTTLAAKLLDNKIFKYLESRARHLIVRPVLYILNTFSEDIFSLL